VQTLEGPEGSIEWVRWHPKGNVLLAGSDDMTMWMWLALTGTYMQVGHVEWCCALGSGSIFFVRVHSSACVHLLALLPCNLQHGESSEQNPVVPALPLPKLIHVDLKIMAGNCLALQKRKQ